MRFRFIRQVDHPVNTYQGQTVETGEEVEFTGHFIDKALSNPEFEAVQISAPKKKRAKKKVTRRGQD